MPAEFKTNLNGVTIAGTTYFGATDLDLVFEPRAGAAPAANSFFRTLGGVDLSDRYYPLSLGGLPLEVPTGFRIASGADINTLYAKRGTLGDPGGGGGACLPFETKVPLWGGGMKRLGALRPGDTLMGLSHPQLKDESEDGWQNVAVGREDIELALAVPTVVRSAYFSFYESAYVFNGLPVTHEHRFLILERNFWRWKAAPSIGLGDAFFGLNPDQSFFAQPILERNETVERRLFANVDVEDVDCFFFYGPNDELLLSHNPPGNKN